MCTVSYVFSNQSVIITSNRDEKIARPKALVPKTYMGEHKKMFFPKDSKAGGTWYVLDDKGNIMVLLNGAAEKHIRKENYRKSRGLILLEIFDSCDCLDKWFTIDLTDIEPFTLVVFINKQLYQLRWDGTLRDTQKLDNQGRFIWSSSTLYSADIRMERELLFKAFTQNKSEISAEDMAHFHEYTNDDDKENGLIINRNNILITQSITQTIINQNKMIFTHKDLVANQTYENTFLIL
ncbi:NRDE family protein [Flavobacterium sp. H122]|uniref:NRDE family protein n=1 Tax=Flavobacterium sp. H122 TaxID=2529860 RepID=UPI0010AB189C|nr:NRDE family protein [Flavobacterium sp. H122]